MKRRLLAVTFCALSGLGILGTQAAHASGDYWACIAIDKVDVGACLENPLPDPSQYGSLRGIIYDKTGVRV